MEESLDQESLRRELWVYPQKPSTTQKKLFCELVRLARDEYGIEEGPILELRCGIYWIDICFIINGYKLAIEVDGPIHNERKLKDDKKDSYLRSRGWKLVRVPVRFIDYNHEFVARRILDEIVKIVGLS